MPETDDWTIGRLLQWTTDYLKRQAADTPRLDAELLLAEARSCRRIDLYAAFDQVVPNRQRAAFRELVRRRAEGTPVAYLLGRREFYSLSFRVTPDVLIPRPETELVVVALLDRLRPRDGDDRRLDIADVGTGSGILAVCAARHVPRSHVTATDSSRKALAVAKANAADHGVAERIEFFEGDLFAGAPDRRQFDFVLSNPPYVSEAEFDELAREVKDHEPRSALVAGPSGTEFIARLVPQSAGRLREGGWLILEISPMIEEAVHRLIARDDRFEPAATIKDLAKLPRVVAARKKMTKSD